jgi:hypothetical protein
MSLQDAGLWHFAFGLSLQEPTVGEEIQVERRVGPEGTN